MPANLRQRAEAFLQASPAETPVLPTRDVQELLHELQVYQAELEIQNEELRRAQQELAGARDRYLELYQSMPVGCLTLDARRAVLDGNLAAVSLLAGAGHELVGQRLDRFVAPEDADACYLLLQQAAATSNRQRRDLRFRRPDGAWFWVDLEAAPALATGAAAAWRVTLVDISGRKTAEEALARSAADLRSANVALRDSQRAALNLMEDSVAAQHEAEHTGAALQASELRIQQALRVSRSLTFEWQPASDQVVRSASCATILGLVGDAATHDTGQRFFQRVHPDDRERFTQVLRGLTPAADTYSTEYRVVRGDGSVVILEETGQASFDPSGKLQRVFGVSTDITARKHAEEALRELNTQLGEANADLTRLNHAMVGRELRMIELKKEVNEVCALAGQPPRYALRAEEERQERQ